MVYSLKTQIANSPLYSLAQDDASADFKLVVVTVADSSDATEGAFTVERGSGPHILCADGLDITTIAFDIGSNQTDVETQRLIGMVDQNISALPVQTQ